MTIEEKTNEEIDLLEKKLEYLQSRRDYVRDHPFRYVAKSAFLPGYLLMTAIALPKSDNPETASLRRGMILLSSMSEIVRGGLVGAIVYNAVKYFS